MIRGAVAVGVCAIALTASSQALASEGTDAVYSADEVTYTADPGEANRFTADGYSLGLHLRDSGAVIRWLPSQGAPNCSAAVHDVFCIDRGDTGFAMNVRLGDGDDTFTNLSTWPAQVQLGPGDDKAVGGGGEYVFDGGPGADDFHGGLSTQASTGTGWAVTYENSPGPVTVSADDVANDGTAGEGDNVHSDVFAVWGSPGNDTISGFASEAGGSGDDVSVGTAGDDTIFDDEGNDELTGGAGRDTLVDQRGDNTFYARDGEVDRIWCSAGHDTVYADPQDILEPPTSTTDGGPCDDVAIG